MAKPKTQFICQNCGASYQKWTGQCTSCNEWNTIVEELPQQGFSKAAQSDAQVISLVGLAGSTQEVDRVDTGIEELNRVLGGGLVPGSAILLGGDPGIGKSTLLLQFAAKLTGAGKGVLYITGEESVEQVRLRGKRLGVAEAPVKLASATSVNDMLATMAQEKPAVMIVDSIQTMFVRELDSAPGTVSQVRMAAHELIQAAKQQHVALVLVGHVTKEGQIAGPKVLEHMVDTVLYFEGDRGMQFRIIRVVKNRYGAVNEIGVFDMQDGGLKEVPNPSALFISGKAGEVAGSVIYAGMEGSRPVMTEIQALVAPSTMAQPRRAVVGWDTQRLAMVLAVLQTRGGYKLMDKEVYLNVGWRAENS